MNDTKEVFVLMGLTVQEDKQQWCQCLAPGTVSAGKETNKSGWSEIVLQGGMLIYEVAG